MGTDARTGNGARPDPPTVSIIVPTIRANPQLLDECIASLTSTAPQAEILVVDEGLPFAEHCNLGASRAHGDYLVFVNDDCIAHAFWLDPLLSAFIESDVAIAGARLLYADGSVQHSGVYFGMDNDTLTAYNMTWEHPTSDVDAVTGACLAIPRQFFMDCEGFDEGYINGYEDIDLCLRVRSAGWRIRYVAESTLTHYESQSGQARWSHVAHNIARLQELWSVKQS